MGGNSKPEVKYIKLLLREAGIAAYDPKVVNQLLSFTYNHVSATLEDATEFSQHANKENIDVSDVSLAIKYKDESKPLHTNELILIARERNSTPLPVIKLQKGVPLPSEKYCTTATNYGLIHKKKEMASTNVTNIDPSSTTLVRKYMFPTVQSTILNRPVPRFVIKMTNNPTSNKNPYLKRKTSN
ncbi:TBP-associated factor 9 [Carabus blaptoides fortunei]